MIEAPLAYRVTWSAFPDKVDGAMPIRPTFVEFATKAEADALKAKLKAEARGQYQIVVAVTPVYLSRQLRGKANKARQTSVAAAWAPAARVLT